MTHDDFNKSMEAFSNLRDPRTPWKIHHKFTDILAIALIGTIAGCDTWEDIEDFANDREEWLRTLLELPEGIPSHDTIERLFAVLSPKSFSECFIKWASSFCDSFAREIYSIDGKTVRGSRSKTKGIKPLHVVSVWASENRMVLGQIAVKEKSNEITAIPEILDMVDVEGGIVTIDAMGCQKEIVQKIVDKKADYVLALKGNQGTLHEEVSFFFLEELKSKNWKKSIDYFSTIEKDHGRIEKREYYIATSDDSISEHEEWNALKTIGMVVSHRTIGDETTVEKRYYISSIEKNVTEFARAVRSHWGIENSLHWCLDVGFREDANRNRHPNTVNNMTIIRHTALNLLKNEKSYKRGISAKRLKAGRNTDYLEKALFPQQS